jgi:hypothetical protein
MPETYCLHWPDSELAGVTQDPSMALRLRFAAAFCRRTADGVAGYLRPVELVFHAATWRGDDPALCLGGIAHGSLLVDGIPVGAAAHALALPLEARGATVCEFRLISGTALRIEAQAVTARLGDDVSFHESLAC